MILELDFETRSTCDLKKCGHAVYAAHSSTEIQCLAYKIEGCTTKLITKDQLYSDNMHEGLLDLVNDSRVLFYAHNAAFERMIWEHIMHRQLGWPSIPIERWRCTAAIAAYKSLPRSLDQAGSVLKLPIQKDKEGYNLMLKMCKPRKPRKSEREKDVDWESKTYWHETPEQYTRLGEYCKVDVDTESLIRPALGDLPLREQKVWELDQRINDRGVYLDIPMIKHALNCIEKHEGKLLSEMNTLTSGTVKSPRQVAEMLKWLRTRGVMSPSLNKETVDYLLSTEMPDDARRILEIRQSLGKSSTAKYEAMMRYAGEGNRARHTILYHGASTGRFSGKGIQPQNLPRGEFTDFESALELIEAEDLEGMGLLYGDPMMVLSSCVRPMICAAPGKELVCADFSAIEGRVLAWIAGEEHILNDYRAGRDPYKVAAAGILKKPYEMVTKSERKYPGKVAELACGYQGGVGAARKFGAVGEDEEIKDLIVKPWRKNRPMTVKLWKALEVAAIDAVENKKTTQYRNIKFGMRGNFLLCELPSGRLLSYYKPHLEPDKYGMKLMTWSLDSLTKAWSRSALYGGLWAENCIAGDMEVLVYSKTSGATWIYLKDYTEGMWIYDGTDFIKGGKLLDRGVQIVIEYSGIYLTPDHRILCSDQIWRPVHEVASSNEKFTRHEVWLPYHNIIQPLGWASQLVDCTLRLWKRNFGNGGCNDPKKRPGKEIMWMQNFGIDARKSDNAWHDESSFICDMAVNARSMQATHSSGMAQLRSKGYSSLRKMASELREFLRGYKRWLSKRLTIGSQGQSGGLYTEQYPMGDSTGKCQQQTQQYSDTHALGGDDNRRSLQTIGDWSNNNTISNQQKLAPREILSETRFHEARVYDIQNCGPRRCFVVRGALTREMIIAHNCTQAVSRDLMVRAIVNAEKAGYPVVMHIHDELLCEVDKGTGNIDEFCKTILNPMPEWAAGLPMAAEGWVGHRYRKD